MRRVCVYIGGHAASHGDCTRRRGKGLISSSKLSAIQLFDPSAQSTVWKRARTRKVCTRVAHLVKTSHERRWLFHYHSSNLDSASPSTSTFTTSTLSKIPRFTMPESALAGYPRPSAGVSKPLCHSRRGRELDRYRLACRKSLCLSFRHYCNAGTRNCRARSIGSCCRQAYRLARSSIPAGLSPQKATKTRFSYFCCHLHLINFQVRKLYSKTSPQRSNDCSNLGL